MHPSILAGVMWDPQIRGFLVVLTAFVILPGSVFFLLSTNVGARIGFTLAVAGLTGWLVVLSGVWMVYGIGLKGRDPSWKAKEIITGSLATATTPAAQGFPKGWKEFQPTDPKLADAQAAADHVLASSAANASPHPGEAAEPPKILEQFPSPFKNPTDYVPVRGYTRGGDNQLFTIGRHKFTFRHSPHYTVVQVQPAIPRPANAVGRPEPDFSKPTVSVIQLRDLGSVRFPPFVLMLASGLTFGVCCWTLHQRDKEILRLRANPALA